MRVLTNPILHDCARIIDRHPDLSPDYKRRLLDGLDSIDHVLAYLHDTPSVPDGGDLPLQGNRHDDGTMAVRPKVVKR